MAVYKQQWISQRLCPLLITVDDFYSFFLTKADGPKFPVFLSFLFTLCGLIDIGDVVHLIESTFLSTMWIHSLSCSFWPNCLLQFSLRQAGHLQKKKHDMKLASSRPGHSMQNSFETTTTRLCCLLCFQRTAFLGIAADGKNTSKTGIICRKWGYYHI